MEVWPYFIHDRNCINIVGEGVILYIPIQWTLCRLSIRSLISANSVGSIKTTKTLQKSRKQLASRRKRSPTLDPGSFYKVDLWGGFFSFCFPANECCPPCYCVYFLTFKDITYQLIFKVFRQFNTFLLLDSFPQLVKW